LATAEELMAAIASVRLGPVAGNPDSVERHAWLVSGQLPDPDAPLTLGVFPGPGYGDVWAEKAGITAATRCALLRDIFGNPFRPHCIEPAPEDGWITLDTDILRWNDGTVPRMARRIYEERDWRDLPVLHDALLDAGADDEALLEHCRNGGPHARGCFVLDLILGKS
jgi:hypothetical protein